MEAEYLALKEILDADDPEVFKDDPRYSRCLEFWDRQDELNRMAANYRVRRGADPIVSNPEAEQGRLIGGLVDEEPDVMLIHTREAFHVFTGRARDPMGKVPPIIGGRRAAASLRSLWYLSGKDNPFADWALVASDDRVEEVRQHIRAVTHAWDKMLKKALERGLSFSVLKSKQPAAIELGFKSPYGYGIAELIVEYDYACRLIKTLERKDQMSDEEGSQALRQLRRRVRGLFEEPCRFERYLTRTELVDLSRRDFLANADEAGTKRVLAAVGIFGEVPREIFVGEVLPRHSKRHLTLSPREIRLLEQVESGVSNAGAVLPDEDLEQGLL